MCDITVFILKAKIIDKFDLNHLRCYHHICPCSVYGIDPASWTCLSECSNNWTRFPYLLHLLFHLVLRFHPAMHSLYLDDVMSLSDSLEIRQASTSNRFHSTSMSLSRMDFPNLVWSELTMSIWVSQSIYQCIAWLPPWATQRAALSFLTFISRQWSRHNSC